MQRLQSTSRHSSCTTLSAARSSSLMRYDLHRNLHRSRGCHTTNEQKFWLSDGYSEEDGQLVVMGHRYPAEFSHYGTRWAGQETPQTVEGSMDDWAVLKSQNVLAVLLEKKQFQKSLPWGSGGRFLSKLPGKETCLDWHFYSERQSLHHPLGQNQT